MFYWKVRICGRFCVLVFEQPISTSISNILWASCIKRYSLLFFGIVTKFNVTQIILVYSTPDVKKSSKLLWNIARRNRSFVKLAFYNTHEFSIFLFSDFLQVVVTQSLNFLMRRQKWQFLLFFVKSALSKTLQNFWKSSVILQKRNIFIYFSFFPRHVCLKIYVKMFIY